MPSSSARTSRKRDQLIIDNMPQVRMLAARFRRRCPSSVAMEDLVSAGTIDLVQAADRYDPRRNVQFKTLADHRIRGTMLDYLRELDPLPRDVRRFQRERESATAKLEQILQDSPSDEDIAAFMNISVERYRYLDEIAHIGSERLGISAMPDEIPIADHATPYNVAWTHVIAAAVDSLPQRERAVIVSMLAGCALTETAARLRVTPSRISQLKSRAIVRLRIALGAAPANQSNRVVCKAGASERAI